MVDRGRTRAHGHGPERCPDVRRFGHYPRSDALTSGDSVTIENVRVNGVPVSPGNVTATKGGTELRYVALSGLDFTQFTEVTGYVTFSVDEGDLPTDDPHDVLTALGIDRR